MPSAIPGSVDREHFESGPATLDRLPDEDEWTQSGMGIRTAKAISLTVS